MDTNAETVCTPYNSADAFQQIAYQDLLLVPIYIIIAFCYLLHHYSTEARIVEAGVELCKEI